MNMLLKGKFMAGLSLLLAAGMVTVNSARAQAATTAANSASDAEDQGVMKLEKLVVTGSNIPSAADALTVPVTVMGPQEIANTGVATNVLDVLRKAMPQFSGNGNIGSENANIGSGTTYGGASISLHNLTTLVLINGRRVAFSPATASGGGEFVDVNMIPLAAIERIETLSDGASAIYGSDAVSGVVNIILKNNYQGFEVGGHYGVTNNTGHYSERSAYVVGGVSDGKTSVTVSAQWSQSDPIWQYQREFSADQTGKTTYYPGVIDIYDFATGNDPYYVLRSDLNAPPGGGTYTIQDLIAQGVYQEKTEAEVSGAFNLAKYVTTVMDQKRKSVFVALDHKLADRVTLFGDFIYSNTESQSQINGQPIYPFVSTPYMDYELTGETPAPAAGIGTGYILATQPNVPFSTDFINQGQDYPNNYDETTGQWVLVHNRFIDHPRVYHNDATLLRGVVGARGQFLEDYQWEVAANLNRNTLDYHNPGVINVNAFTAAMNAGKINPFARTQAAGALTADIIGAAQASFLSTLQSFDAKVSGSLVDLPGGKLAFAVGGMFTRETLNAEPDALSIPDANDNIGWAGATSLSPFNASRRIKAAFLEVQAPIVSPGMAVPFVRSLDIDVAGRIENYSDSGTSKVPKFSLRYQPLDDQLTLRATAGQSFTAPQLYYVYGPLSSGFTQSLQFNLYNGGVSPKKQFQSRSGSNPNLQPAKAHTWTAGFVYTPKAVKGLAVSFDFYEINETGILGNFDAAVVAQDVELKGAASPYAKYVHIGGWDGPTISTPGQLNATAAANVYMDLPIVNLAGQKIRGFDSTLEYTLNTDTMGKFRFGTTAVIYNSYRVQALPTERYFQYSGYATEGGTGSNGTIPKWRTYTTINWTYKDFDFLLAHTYIPSIVDIGPGGSAPTAAQDVSSYSSFDLAASYNVNTSWVRDLRVTLGVTNVFNKMPPVAPNAFTDANADVGTYSPVGRLFYVDVGYKF